MYVYVVHLNIWSLIDKQLGLRSDCSCKSSLIWVHNVCFYAYEGGSIFTENPFITPFTNALGFNAICQTKDQSVAVIMVHETLFYLSKFNKLQTF